MGRMSDPISVRFPCQHGIWFRHMVKPVGVKPVWCEGGQTKLLREGEPGLAATGETYRVWVEVEQ